MSRAPWDRLAAWLSGSGEGARVWRNAGWLAADRVGRLLVNLVLNVWLIRSLGAERLGLLSFAQSLVGIVAILSLLGLESILVRDLVRRPDQGAPILGSALGLRLAGAAATLAISLGTMAFLRPGDATALVLALVFAGTTAFQALDVIESWFQSRARVAPYVVARSVAFLLASAAKAWALAVGAPLEVLALTVVGELILGAGALVLAIRRQPDRPPAWRFQPPVARRLLADAWPLMLNSVAVLFAIRLDQTMLTLMRGGHENGIYAAAQRLTEVLFFLPLAVTNAAAPALLASHGRDRVEYERRLGRVLRALLWLAIGLALPISLASGWITTTLFGVAFRDSGAVLAIHIWSAPALFMGYAITSWFVAEGRQMALFVRSAIAATVNILLNLWLIPTLGARGAALATLISQTAAYWLANAVFPSTRGLFRIQCRALLPGAAARS